MIAFAANWLAAFKWRRAVSVHWAERARLLWPVRKSAGANILLLPASFGVLQFARDGHFSAWCVAAAGAAWLGVILGSYPLDREILPAFTFSKWLRFVAITWLLRIVYAVAWAAGAFLMPKRIDWRCFVVIAGFLTFHIMMHLGLRRKILARGGLLVHANDRLEAIVESTTERMHVPKPIVWLLDVPLAGAFALPLTHELLFMTGLMEICDDGEISAICAHELAHLTESKSVLAMRLLGSLSLFPLLFIRPALNAFGFPAGLFLPLILVPVLALQVRILARRMEKRADSVAAEQQSAEGVYARAIEKLYQRNQAPAVAESRRKIHPHLYDRMLAAGIQPDFQRPKPPESISLVHFALWIGMGIVIGFTFARSGFRG